MRIVRFGAALAALVASAQVLTAQQPAPQPPGARGPGGMMGMMDMRGMDSLNARVDSLVSRMNRATGNQKIAAMAEVIKEMVAQRKAMWEHMGQMMRSHEMMMPTGQRPPAESLPAPRQDSAPSDSTDHAGHHPQG